ncbi:hypothetical protein K439DRAFT_1522793 [Ramaria rubella]|nr:hypothetical protein K439DRAFT_1522793 [Ramaria rubella]
MVVEPLRQCCCCIDIYVNAGINAAACCCTWVLPSVHTLMLPSTSCQCGDAGGQEGSDVDMGCLSMIVGHSDDASRNGMGDVGAGLGSYISPENNLAIAGQPKHGYMDKRMLHYWIELSLMVVYMARGRGWQNGECKHYNRTPPADEDLDATAPHRVNG